ncbi:MAG: alkaline phosphatase family protein [Planctomyces sp.]
MKLKAGFILTVLVFVLFQPETAMAYVGPGAGFALAGSFFAVFLAVLSALFMLLTWPIRLLIRTLRGRRIPASAPFRRIVILGLDGLDHGLTTQMLEAGKLPNLARLRDQGSFSALRSTLPPISPVAWSSFQTGVNPGKHNIFDFLVPDEKTYRPKMSSVEILPSTRRLKIGPWSIPYGRPDVRLLRKSRPFWSLLSERGIFSSVIRVPITFPPEKLHGVQLSAMCTPDLRGTQGEFSLFTTDATHRPDAGGLVTIVERTGNIIRSELSGPPNPWRPDKGPLRVPFSLEILSEQKAVLKIQNSRVELMRNQYTEWIPVVFRASRFRPGSGVSGVCRFLWLDDNPEFRLYVTPINIDPEKPAMPIGYPSIYPIYLAKRQGSYATLGLAEDTWGLNDHVLNDDHFLEQCLSTDRERESMFFDALDKSPEGFCVCVFDGTDRMQHMFWRYLDEQHPARPDVIPEEHRNAIEDLYQRMDELVGRTMEKCQGDKTLLMVLSDHGFNTFRRGVDLNCWLEQNGYLVVDDNRRNEDYLSGIDWSRTRAFAIGLTGIFLNLKDRFAEGIVDSGADAQALRTEIASRLEKLTDPKSGQLPIRKVYQALQTYQGPYREQAPDLIIGYDRGYRVSWEAANGRTTRELFHDNTKAWSGDHCVDPSVVPGILFCNHPVTSDHPRLLDIAPTVLNLFGLSVPGYMDGKALNIGREQVLVNG